MLRAVRFAANWLFRSSRRRLKPFSHAPEIQEVSVERVADELTRLLTLGGAGEGMRLLMKTGLLEELLPEVTAMRGVKQPPKFHPEGDVWTHTVKMLDLMSTPADSRLAWGVLLHDVGKPDVQSRDHRGIHFYGHVQQGEILAEGILRRLRFPRADMECILGLIRCHMSFINVREMRTSRLKRLLRSPISICYWSCTASIAWAATGCWIPMSIACKNSGTDRQAVEAASSAEGKDCWRWDIYQAPFSGRS
jgi:poly(A) polymerase